MGMRISEIIKDKYKLRIPPTVYYELLADVQELEEEQEPTTKNDKVDCEHTDCNNCVNHKYCDYESNKSENPTGSTTKNDLGVDCISREEALVAIRNLYPSMPRVDFNGSLRKWVDKYKPYIECDDAIKQLPSVNPQEPVVRDNGVKNELEPITKNDDVVVLNFDDCISRQAVVDMTGLSKWFDSSDSYNEFVIALSDLPSVTPQEPKTGEWIEHFDESGKWYECDQCHTDWGGAVNYCPNCGAKMVEPQESEDT